MNVSFRELEGTRVTNPNLNTIIIDFVKSLEKPGVIDFEDQRAGFHKLVKALEKDHALLLDLTRWCEFDVRKKV